MDGPDFFLLLCSASLSVRISQSLALLMVTEGLHVASRAHTIPRTLGSGRQENEGRGASGGRGGKRGKGAQPEREREVGEGGGGGERAILFQVQT